MSYGIKIIKKHGSIEHIDPIIEMHIEGDEISIYNGYQKYYIKISEIDSMGFYQY